MTPSDYIDLRCGSSRWLRLAHMAVTLLAGLGIVFTHSAWSWKILTLLALLSTYLFTSRRMKKNDVPGSLRNYGVEANGVPEAELVLSGGLSISTDGISLSNVWYP